MANTSETEKKEALQPENRKGNHATITEYTRISHTELKS